MRRIDFEKGAVDYRCVSVIVSIHEIHIIYASTQDCESFTARRRDGCPEPDTFWLLDWTSFLFGPISYSFV